jgi:flagellar hook-associated protein FlgK
MNKPKSVCDPKVWDSLDSLTDQINKVQAELTKLRRMVESQSAQIESINTRMKPVGGFLDD